MRLGSSDRKSTRFIALSTNLYFIEMFLVYYRRADGKKLCYACLQIKDYSPQLYLNFNAANVAVALRVGYCDVGIK